MPQEILRVAVATPLDDELRRLILDAEPRIQLLVDDALLPPMRFPADFAGDPAFERSAGQQARFEALLGRADALYGIPDASPAQLRRAIDANPGLRWVHTMAAGGGSQVAAAGLTPAQLARVTFTTSAGVHGRALAEFALLGLLAAAKQLPQLQADQRDRRWPENRRPMRQLADSRILVAGLGGIGREVIHLLSSFRADVIGMSINPPTGQLPLSRWIEPSELLDVVAEVDAVVTTLPGTARTTHLFGAEVFERFTPGTTLVNVGRGSVIDESALVRALVSGRIGFAALDVFETEPLAATSPLWAMPNVLVSPHTAALDPQEGRRIAALFAANATRLLENEALVNVVDTLEFY